MNGNTEGKGPIILMTSSRIMIFIFIFTMHDKDNGLSHFNQYFGAVYECAVMRM